MRCQDDDFRWAAGSTCCYLPGLVSAPTTYKPNYLVRDPTTAGPYDFDIVTELVFPDRAAYQNWVATTYAAGSGVADDEINFLDRTLTRSYVVEEYVTDDA